MNKKQIEKAIKAKFVVSDNTEMEKDGGHWWFIVDSDKEFESIALLTSYTRLEQNTLDEWVSVFQSRYTRHFGFAPTLRGDLK